MRNRKCGETNIATMAVRMPYSTSCPCRAEPFTNRINAATSARVTGRRYARLAKVDRILSTQAEPVFGSQTRIFLRLVFSTGLGNGPTTVTVSGNLFFFG